MNSPESDTKWQSALHITWSLSKIYMTEADQIHWEPLLLVDKTYIQPGKMPLLTDIKTWRLWYLLGKMPLRACIELEAQVILAYDRLTWDAGDNTNSYGKLMCDTVCWQAVANCLACWVCLHYHSGNTGWQNATTPEQKLDEWYFSENDLAKCHRLCGIPVSCHTDRRVWNPLLNGKMPKYLLRACIELQTQVIRSSCWQNAMLYAGSILRNECGTLYFMAKCQWLHTCYKCGN
jgi:hypothetical protein